VDAPEQDVIVEPKEAPRDPSIRDVLAELEAIKEMMRDMHRDLFEQGCRFGNDYYD
jgi:hypothetical protein